MLDYAHYDLWPIYLAALVAIATSFWLGSKRAVGSNKETRSVEAEMPSARQTFNLIKNRSSVGSIPKMLFSKKSMN